MTDALAGLLRALYWEPWQAILTLDLWWANLIIALLLMAKMVFGGWMLAKAGRSPLWVLLLLINGADIVALWIFAYVRWPFVDGARTASAGPPDVAPGPDAAPGPD